MTVIIRKAEARDVKRICEIVSQMTPGLPHDYREAVLSFRAKIENNPDYFLWVAEDGEVVGTAMMHLQHKLSYCCGTAAHLEDVVVDNKYRGKGVGKLLVNKAVEQAKLCGAYKIMLTCYQKTIPYYTALGFKEHDFGMRMSLIENEHPTVKE